MPGIKKFSNNNQPAVFIGIEKDKAIEFLRIQFNEGVAVDLDLILASIVMRHRQVMKNLFNSANIQKIRETAVNMEQEDIYKIILESTQSFDASKLGRLLSKDMLVFFLSKDACWKVVGCYDVLSLKEPMRVDEVLKRYYDLYYPPAVSEYAFSNPKLLKRVFHADDHSDREEFFFEPLFIKNQSSTTDSLIVAK